MDVTERLGRIEADIAVIKAELVNHVTNLREDVLELRRDLREVRERWDRGGRNGTREWRTLAFQTLGWFVALLLAVLQYLLNIVK